MGIQWPLQDFHWIYGRLETSVQHIQFSIVIAGGLYACDSSDAAEFTTHTVFISFNWYFIRSFKTLQHLSYLEDRNQHQIYSFNGNILENIAISYEKYFLRIKELNARSADDGAIYRLEYSLRGVYERKKHSAVVRFLHLKITYENVYIFDSIFQYNLLHFKWLPLWMTLIQLNYLIISLEWIVTYT